MLLRVGKKKARAIQTHTSKYALRPRGMVGRVAVGYAGCRATGARTA